MAKSSEVIRELRPTDLLSYLALKKLFPASEALLYPNGQSVRLGLRFFLGEAFPLNLPGACWVLVERARILGLISIHPQPAADIWTIQSLWVSPEADGERVYALLLDHLLLVASEEGVQKVNIRLGSDSAAIAPVRKSGFSQYATELVYLRESIQPLSVPAEPRLRQRRPIDHQPLFQLYCSAVPLHVRQFEGMTLQEWRLADGWRRGGRLFGGSAGRADFVLDQAEGAYGRESGHLSLVGWLQVERRQRLLGLLLAKSDPDDLLPLISFGVNQIGVGRPAFLALRDYQLGLAIHLDRYGFSPVGEHLLFARTLAQRVPEARLVPIGI